MRQQCPRTVAKCTTKLNGCRLCSSISAYHLYSTRRVQVHCYSSTPSVSTSNQPNCWGVVTALLNFIHSWKLTLLSFAAIQSIPKYHKSIISQAEHCPFHPRTTHKFSLFPNQSDSYMHWDTTALVSIASPPICLWPKGHSGPSLESKRRSLLANSQWQIHHRGAIQKGKKTKQTFYRREGTRYKGGRKRG